MNFFVTIFRTILIVFHMSVMAKSNEDESFFRIEVTDVEGNSHKLDKYRGKVMLIANVASKCGLAEGFYTDLAKVADTYSTEDLVILLFPCNQFNNQEFENNSDIKAFVESYSKKFKLMDKVDVKGSNIHPIFKHLTEKSTGHWFWWNNNIKWNFAFFLVGRDGALVKRYARMPFSKFPVNEPYLVACIENKNSAKLSANCA